MSLPPTPLLSRLLQDEPTGSELLHQKLLSLGLAEHSAPPESPAEAPASHNSVAGHRFVVPAGVAPKTRRSSSTFGRSPRSSRASTKAAPRPAVTEDNGASRAESLLRGLARGEAEALALSGVVDALAEDLARSSAPARALLNFARLCDAVEDRAAFFRELGENAAFRGRLARLLSWSQSLSETLINDTRAHDGEALDLVRTGASPVSRPQLRALAQAAIGRGSERAERMEALRMFRRREFVRIGLLDMESATWRSEEDFSLVVRQISDVAQVVVQTALQVLAPGASGFCVLIMGKGGARELNPSSDIDLIFLHEGEAGSAEELGQELLRELGAQSVSGQLYRVDMRLRPEGTAGPLVTPFGYALGYYESFAAPWEWQAMIKARVIAGDARLGRRFRKFTRGVTWARRADDSHLHAIVEMKKRSEATADGQDARNVKSGPGGIRDAEWVVQQLQMMVGPTHPRARAKATLRALQVLEEMGALARDEADRLREGYLWMRVTEHRLQWWEERAVRSLPASSREKAALARRMGTTARGEVAARQLDEEHARHQRDVRALCEKLFWSWRPEDGEAAAQEAASAAQVLSQVLAGVFPLSFQAEARARIERLSEGTPLRPFPAPLARQIRAAVPDALKYLPVAAKPERALANLERLCEASGNRLSLLRELADSPTVARAAFMVLGGSQELADTLIRFPELIDLPAQSSSLERPRSGDEIRSDCRSYCLAFRDRGAALRRWKKRQMLRLALRDFALDFSPPETAREISEVCRAALELAVEEIGRALQPDSSCIGFAVLGMGKLGGGEMHPASDADVIFVHEAYDPSPSAGELATKWALEIGKYLGERTEDGSVFEIDARLRPEGRSGAMAPSIEGFLLYFERAVGGLAVWERQALTRARFVAGDAQTGARLMAAICHVAYPANWNPDWSDELRHIKERVESERGRLSAGIYDVKLGRGALSDIEWTAQWLALKHGAMFPQLQGPNTLQVLAGAVQAQVLARDDLQVLEAAYTFFRRAEIRLHTALDVRGSSLKSGTPEWKSWARAVFPESSEAEHEFEEAWRSHTRGVREIFERVRARI
jgi:glutamate-ammonia-ligase adenylyltransferase